MTNRAALPTLELRGQLSRNAEARTTHEGEAVLRVSIEQHAKTGSADEIVCDLALGVAEVHHLSARHRAAALRRGCEVCVVGTGIERGRAGPLRQPVLRMLGCTSIAPLTLPPAHHEPERLAQEPA